MIFIAANKQALTTTAFNFERGFQSALIPSHGSALSEPIDGPRTKEILLHTVWS